MESLTELIKKWDIEFESNQKPEIKYRKYYSNLLENLRILVKYKFEPYQPLPHPDEKDFITRFLEWIDQFDDKKKKYMLYLASKIIFFTRKQLDFLMKNIYERKIKKKILEDIIDDKKIDNFEFKEAVKYFQDELDQTLFCELTKGGKLDEFMHINKEIKRDKSTGLNLPDVLSAIHDIKKPGLDEREKQICKEFESLLIEKHKLMKSKKRLVILEENCCSGTNFRDFLRIIKEIDLPFKSIILAPYVITSTGKKTIEEWIEQNKSAKYNITLVFSAFIPKEMKCFEEDESYLKTDWKDNGEICQEIKSVCDELYQEKFSKNLREVYKYGYKEVKIIYVNYYNCPNNSLPLIWFNNIEDWKSLFMRSSRLGDNNEG